MFLTNPIWLWALAGLSIPITIHLLSRKEGKVIYIGSIRHLQETSTQQFKGIRLNELVLLALRSLLIILFVLLLSGLSYYKKKGNDTPWVLVENGLNNLDEVKSQLVKFRNEGFEIRVLAPGFPLLKDSAETSSPILYKKLIEELTKKDISEVIIFSRSSVAGFSGLRSSLPINIKWISISSKPTEYILASYASTDSVITRVGHSNANETHFTTEILSNSITSTSSGEPLRINLVSDKAHQYDKKIIDAALRALELEYHRKIDITNSTPEKPELKKYDWVIWLASPPANSFDSVHVIDLLPGDERDIIVQKASRRWTITKRLHEEIALNENLTLWLASVIIPSNQELALKNDRRMVPDSIAWNAENKSYGGRSMASQSANTYLVSIFLVILLVERMLAYHKNQ